MSMFLTRTRATLAFAGATLLPLCTILPLLLLDRSGSPLEWVQAETWPLLSILALILAALMPFIILGIYAGQSEEMGWLGFAGTLVTVVGLLAYVWFQFDMAFVWPVLAEHAPELIDYDGPMFRDPLFSFAHLWMGVVDSIGILMFGVALFRARVLPRTAGVLFTIGMILSAGVLFPPFFVRAVGGVVGAVALGWIGAICWQSAACERP